MDKVEKYGIVADWFDWTDAAHVDQQDVAEMIGGAIEKVRAQVAAGSRDARCTISCGDRVVEAEALEDKILVKVLRPLYDCGVPL